MRIHMLIAASLLGAGLAAAQTCSPADARGAYVLKLSGWQDLGPKHPALPNAMGPAFGVGIITLDGAGKGSGRGNFSAGGVAQAIEFQDLQYTVREDCGGIVSYQIKDTGTNAVLGPDKVEIRILDDGARITGLTTETGGRTAILTAEFSRMSRGARACHASMLRGTYAAYYGGWMNMQMLNPNQPAYFAPMSGLGLFVLDPDGGFRGGGIHNWGGMQLATDIISSTVTVNADCTGIFDYVMQVKGSPNKSPGRSLFVLSGDGARLTMLMPAFPALQYFDRVSIP